VFSFLPREQPACPLNQNVTQSRAEDLLQPSTCLQQLRSEIRANYSWRQGWLRSRLLQCNVKKQNEGSWFASIRVHLIKLTSRRGRLNLAILDFLASWILSKNIGIACHDPNAWGSSNRTR
jgi:hypothetical protein